MNDANGVKQILIHGMFFILVGLLWGLVVPHTPYPRLALSAHIGFEGNGLLYMVLAIVLMKLPHSVGRKSIGVMLLAVWLTWVMMLSEIANAWWGATQILPIAARQAGATGGAPWQEYTVTLAHIVCGLALIVAWMLLIFGFVKKPVASSAD